MLIFHRHHPKELVYIWSIVTDTISYDSHNQPGLLLFAKPEHSVRAESKRHHESPVVLLRADQFLTDQYRAGADGSLAD